MTGVVMRFALGLALLLVGCDDDETGMGDMAVQRDLAIPDLAVGRDLALADLSLGTNWDGEVACSPGACAMPGLKYVWNSMQLPMTRADYAWDLNGDGRPDNQLGNIEGALAAQNLDSQPLLDADIAAGRRITLLDQVCGEENSSCMPVTLWTGQMQPSPDYSGNGHFMVDTTVPSTAFVGTAVTGKFSSQPPPALAGAPYVVRMRLPLLNVSRLVDVVGARLSYTHAVNGGLYMGQLNGAIRQYDVDHVVVPAIAEQLTLDVQADPTSSRSQLILALFDVGGRSEPACGNMTCQNFDGTCAVSGDHKIDECEVATSSLVQNLLAPDVQLFDANGNYHPNPANTKKDCLSVGFGFTAVRATF
jgi:hypothetical protein